MLCLFDLRRSQFLDFGSHDVFVARPFHWEKAVYHRGLDIDSTKEQNSRFSQSIRPPQTQGEGVGKEQFGRGGDKNVRGA